MVNLPLWQRILIVLVLIVGTFIAFPNLRYSQVEQANDAATRIAAGKAVDGDAALAQSWPDYLPSDLVNLGLDLRGGVHVIVEVNIEEVYQERYDSFWETARTFFTENRTLYGNAVRLADENAVIIAVDQPDQLEAAAQALRDEAERLGAIEYDVTAVNGRIEVRLNNAGKARIDELTMERSLEIIRRRIDAAGTKEPTIVRQGEDRVVIDVPGFGSVEEVLALIGQTAKLTMQQVLSFTDNPDQQIDFDQQLLPSSDGGYVLLDRAAKISGDMIIDAYQGFQPDTGLPIVNFRLNTEGAKRFGEYTASHVGDYFAIVLDGEVISAPRINTTIAGGSAFIEGNFTVETANELAILLRAGALPASLNVLEQSVVGPDLGQDSIDAGRMAALVALAVVAVYMVFVYRSFGLFANIALLFNMVMIVALLSLTGQVLTLPGIAGIVLTIGMAVDANVLVFERIREEYSKRPILVRAIDQGYARAFSSILDANVTTFIAAAVLYFLGAGPIKGFSITLMIGIVTSVFTAIYVTRLFIVIYLDRAKPKKLGF